MAERTKRSFRTNPYPKDKPRPEFEVLRKVEAQTSFRRNLILVKTLDSSESIYSMLQGAVNYIGSALKVVNTQLPTFEQGQNVNLKKYCLSIDNEQIVDGFFANESLAKNGLAETAVEKLSRTCFTLVRKIHPSSSPQVNLPPTSTDSGNSKQPSNSIPKAVESSLNGGVGEKMMKLMGWAGGGLGPEGKGCTDIVESYIQIDRAGLGSKNIAQGATKILQQYKASNSINSVAFSKGFSKEDRSVIHQVARKLNLKSKSYNSGDDRIIVVQSKMRRIDLVRSILEVGGENEQYQLLFPTDFMKS